LEWRKQEADARKELQSIAEIGARAVDTYFDVLQRSLKGLVDTLPEVRQHDIDSAEFKSRAHDVIAVFHATHPELTNVVLIRADGQVIVAANRPFNAPSVSVAEQPSFKNYLNTFHWETDIGRPMYGSVAKEWVVPVRFSVVDGSANLLYFIGASVPVDFIANFWRDASIVSKASLGVFRDDGYLLSRYPNPELSDEVELYGSPRTGGFMIYLRENEFPHSGFTTGVASADGTKNVLAFRRLLHFPVTFFVIMPMQELWKTWWLDARVSLTLTLILLLGGIAASVLFARVQNANNGALHQALELSKRIAGERDIAINSMTQGLCMFDANQRLIICNKQYRDLYKLTEEQVKIGATLRQILKSRSTRGMTPEEEAKYIERRVAQLSKVDPHSITNQLNDGRFIYVVHQPMQGGGWVATHEDVTEKRKVEVEQHRAKAFSDTIVQNIPMPIVIKDAASGKFILVNKAFEAFVNLPREKIIGQTVFELYAQEAAAKMQALDLEAMSAENPLHSNEISAETKAKAQLFIRTIRLVVRDNEQQPQYLIVLIDDITERRKAEAKIEQLAHYDALTNLANRNLFKKRIDESLEKLERLGVEFAIFLLDLDRFKVVNDTWGHQTGDALLKKVADRIRATINQVDIAARLGGDEFALIVVLGEDASPEALASLAKRLIDSISAPCEIDGHPVAVGCSIGIAFAPAHGSRSDELLKNADLALYKSKSAGRDCFHVYTDEFRTEADRRNALENDLREAIWRGDLDLYYQPVIDITNGRIRAVEALVRWRHETKGFIAPSEFIPLAEEAGLIIQLGQWVLIKACQDAMKMPDEIKVAVNLSPVQFTKSNLVDAVIFALADSQLPPKRLEVEITEGVLFEETEQNLETLRQMKSAGISIALDDFGVGYSSLSYLTAFPFDKVKIDKSFVDKLDRIESRAVMSSIVQLSQSLNLAVVAEGIETGEQLVGLRALGIELGQGFLFSKAVPLDELEFKSFDVSAKSEAA
ncbi:MAG TPA: EAL domain-containing protein, partial [Xanthobacteraceae bacterium]|nr:EAL domain-containing protein [Xanthobacteraceae bacterium]